VSGAIPPAPARWTARGRGTGSPPRCRAPWGRRVDVLADRLNYPGHRRCGGAVRRPVRHRLGHHEQLFRHRRQQNLSSPWSRRALPRRCSPPPSACSRPFRR
jgi:hypothetical protein